MLAVNFKMKFKILVRRERQQVQPTYTKSSVAIQKERLISTVKDFEFLQSVKEHQWRRSIVYQQFLASQRNARRFALAGTSMMAEVHFLYSLISAPNTP